MQINQHVSPQKTSGIGSRWFLKSLLIAMISVISTIGASAQLSTATMFGTVTDPAGAAIPKASVTLTQTDTGFARTIATNESGGYRADFLPIGPYKVTVTAIGFKKLDREGITLTVTEEAHLDLTMTIGGTDQTIEVTAEIPLLNTGNSTLGRTISNVEIDNLPLVDRNVYTLLDLTPGVQNNNSAGTGANGGVINPLGYPEQHVKINGSSDSGVGQVSYYLDGGSNMTGVRNTGNPLPNPDAIREFAVQTNNYSAQFGRNSSGVVTVLTKSGTNQFHGSAFEFFRDRNFNATTHLASQKTPYNQHRFGGTIGGPIVHDKLFFFFSYAGFRFIAANIFNPTVPSAAMLAGNFTENTPTLTTRRTQSEVHDCRAVGQQVLGVQSLSSEGDCVVRRGRWTQPRAEYLSYEHLRSGDYGYRQGWPDSHVHCSSQLPAPGLQPVPPEDGRAALQGRLPVDDEAATGAQLLPPDGRLCGEPVGQQRSWLGGA